MQDLTVCAEPGSLKRLRRTAWRFQQTFATPLQNLEPFVAGILSARDAIHAGTVTIEAYVFEPKNLKALLSEYSLPPTVQSEFSIKAAGTREAKELLTAALSDWVDFWFVPQPKPFVIYADHDEYTTFFAASKSNLNCVVQQLLKQGFQTVDYVRTF